MKTLTSLALAFLAACVSLPEPEIQVPQDSRGGMAPGEAVTVLAASQAYALSTLANCVEEAMRDAEPDLKIIPGSEFRDALYPWFEPATVPTSADEFAAMLARPAVRRRVGELAIRYVVVAAGGTIGKDEGFFFCGGAGPGVGCLGLSSQDRESSMGAAIWDLKKGVSAGEVTAKTTGTNVYIGVIVPILFLSATETAACEGFGKRLAQFVTGTSPVSE